MAEALITAIKQNQEVIVELMLRYGVDPNSENQEGFTALFTAVQTSRAPIVQNYSNTNVTLETQLMVCP